MNRQTLAHYQVLNVYELVSRLQRPFQDRLPQTDFRRKFAPESNPCAVHNLASLAATKARWAWEYELTAARDAAASGAVASEAFLKSCDQVPSSGRFASLLNRFDEPAVVIPKASRGPTGSSSHRTVLTCLAAGHSIGPVCSLGSAKPWATIESIPSSARAAWARSTAPKTLA